MQQLSPRHFNTLTARQNSCHFANGICKFISLYQNFCFWFSFNCNWFPVDFQSTKSCHWFRWSLNADRAISHYLNQWWSTLRTQICVTRSQRFKCAGWPLIHPGTIGAPPSQLNMCHNYRKTSCISRTKSQNLNVSRLVLKLSLPNSLKPGVKSSMKM